MTSSHREHGSPSPAPQARAPRLLRHSRGVLPFDRPRVMGILNITPDSFSDGGRFLARDDALASARRMIAHGVDVIDVGAESTRPNALPVPAEEEWRRLAPVLAAIIALGAPVSIDTYKADVAAKACALGAVIVNDIWGLQKDPAMAATIAETGAAVIMMHNRDTTDPGLDIIADIDRSFERSMELAARAGIPPERQMLDPGIGFGKTPDQSYKTINRLEHFARHGLPLLVGASRKRLIGAVLDVDTEDRLYGSLALHTIAFIKGAAMVRVHNVQPHVDAARIAHATMSEHAG
ncbi:dihydropteroate synthase [Stappia sp. P2PMeth1]|uniref:dihydropteroate synthase n=1 Tax=Stappia sp. P2PMeth1 TaxID=2003586 RepID=UPI001AD907D4|nr:dihydropteroate synthase [Stappia sp. P2PMeth1]